RDLWEPAEESLHRCPALYRWGVGRKRIPSSAYTDTTAGQSPASTALSKLATTERIALRSASVNAEGRDRQAESAGASNANVASSRRTIIRAPWTGLDSILRPELAFAITAAAPILAEASGPLTVEEGDASGCYRRGLKRLPPVSFKHLLGSAPPP